MTRYFKACPGKEVGSGWPLSFCSGCSSENEDWYVETVYLKADEVPNVCNDAKTFSQLVAGLLNAYYQDRNVVGMNETEVIRLGLDPAELNIPDPKNTTIPFPES